MEIGKIDDFDGGVCVGTKVETRLYRGHLSYGDVDEFLEEKEAVSGVVQAYDPRYVASPRHVSAAAEKAVRSFTRGKNVSNSLDMELLLYVAGTRQIDEALEIAVSPPCDGLISVTRARGEWSRETDETPVNDVVDESERVFDHHGRRPVLRDYFEIRDEEIEAVGEEKLDLLVLERVALLDIDK